MNKISKVTKVQINTIRTKPSNCSVFVECIIKEDDKVEAIVKSFEVEVFINNIKIDNIGLIDANKAKIEGAIINTGDYTIVNIEPTIVGVVCDRYIIFNSSFIDNSKSYTLKSEKIYLLQPIKF